MKSIIKTLGLAAILTAVHFAAPTASALPGSGTLACPAGDCQPARSEDSLVQQASSRGGVRSGGISVPRFVSRGGGSIRSGSSAGRSIAPRGGERYSSRGVPRQIDRSGGSRYIGSGERRYALRDGQRHAGGTVERRRDHAYRDRHGRHDRRHHRRHHDRDFYYFYGWGWPYGYPYDYGYYNYGYYDYGPSYVSDHVQWCLNRYRSYDPVTDTFLGYDGLRHRCVSPYS